MTFGITGPRYGQFDVEPIEGVTRENLQRLRASTSSWKNAGAIAAQIVFLWPDAVVIQPAPSSNEAIHRSLGIASRHNPEEKYR